MKKSNLDEMQEQKLLQLEHQGLWLTFWLLIAAILVQAILGEGFYEIIGETVILLIISIYLCVGCLRNGIWDRKFKPDAKTNLLVSLAAGALIALFTYFRVSHQTNNLSTILASSLILGLFTFGLSFGALMLSAKIYKKRRKELDQE